MSEYVYEKVQLQRQFCSPISQHFLCNQLPCHSSVNEVQAPDGFKRRAPCVCDVSVANTGHWEPLQFYFATETI